MNSDRPTQTATGVIGSDVAAGDAAPVVRVLHSPDRRRIEEEFLVGDDLTLGRGQDGECDVCIDDARMSRRHLQLSRVGQGGHVVVRDCGSRNGTFVEGRPVTSEEVSPGAVLRIGDTILAIDAHHEHVPSDDGMLGESSAWCRTKRKLDAVARSELSVVLMGETGTGKELAARAIHARSGRSGSFVAVNCSAIPPSLFESYFFGHVRGAFTGASDNHCGFFEQARAGTLFLDEVGELPLEQQPKLLRVLENREFSPVGGAKVLDADVRIVAATNANLSLMQSNGLFRPDLYARLEGAFIRLPPLRERRSDIPLLARRFASELLQDAHESFCTAGFIENLLFYRWPLNVRELRNTIQRALVLRADSAPLSGHDLVSLLTREGADDTDSSPRASSPQPAAAVNEPFRLDRDPTRRRGHPSRSELCDRLESMHGNVSRVASFYGKDPKQVYRWLKRFGIDPEQYR